LNTLDIVIVAVAGLFALLGLRKGLVISLATLAGLLLGIWAAIHFSNFFAGLIRDAFHPSAAWLPAIAFTVTFLAVLIGVYFLGKALEKLIKLAGMGILNHAGGALLGLAKGVVLLSVVFFLGGLVDPGGKILSSDTRSHSLFYSPVAKVFPFLMKVSGAYLKLHL
jgi:membrane protein required for colicin V production